MGFQSLDRAEIARQLRLGQGGVYLAMADVVKQDGRTPFPALKLRYQVVHTLFDVPGNRAIA